MEIWEFEDPGRFIPIVFSPSSGWLFGLCFLVFHTLYNHGATVFNFQEGFRSQPRHSYYIVWVPYFLGLHLGPFIKFPSSWGLGSYPQGRAHKEGTPIQPQYIICTYIGFIQPYIPKQAGTTLRVHPGTLRQDRDLSGRLSTYPGRHLHGN